MRVQGSYPGGYRTSPEDQNITGTERLQTKGRFEINIGMATDEGPAWRRTHSAVFEQIARHCKLEQLRPPSTPLLFESDDHNRPFQIFNTGEKDNLKYSRVFILPPRH